MHPNATGKPEVYLGVHLSSRKDEDYEIATMRKIVDGLGIESFRIESIWCDSKAGAVYEISVKSGLWTDAIIDAIEASVVKSGGHNGVEINRPDGAGVSLDPFWPGDEYTFLDFEKTRAQIDTSEILKLKDVLVECFSRENFLEVGFLTGLSDWISNHGRLLRSLNWGDPDYGACVLDLLMEMQRRDDGSMIKTRTYAAEKFPNHFVDAIPIGFVAEKTKSGLGYSLQPSRDDVIAVMMPFRPEFNNVFAAIQKAARHSGLDVKRADQVWDHSFVIHDILSLINHAAIVICDLTGRNENVFYEMGIAHAWGKKVIPITQNPADVPFDLKHHRYLPYLNNSEGLSALESALSQRIGTIKGHA